MAKALQSATASLVLGPENIAAGSTLAHIGATMAPPATFTQGASQRGGARLHVILEEYKEILLIAKFTFALTGGTVNPTIFLGIQRKFDDTVADTVDAAWEDFAGFRSAAALEKVIRLGESAVFTKDGQGSNPGQAYTITRDDVNFFDTARMGLPGPKLRVRVLFQAAGDRTGGTATIDLTCSGINHIRGDGQA